MPNANSFLLVLSVLTSVACGGSPSEPPVETKTTPPTPTLPTIPFASFGAGVFTFSRATIASGVRYLVDANAGIISILPVPILGETRISPDGQHFVSNESAGFSSDLVLRDRSGKSTLLTTAGGRKQTPSWSYDATRIYYTAFDNGDAVLMALSLVTGTSVATPMRTTGPCSLVGLGSVSESSTGSLLFVSTVFEAGVCTGGGVSSIRSDGTGLRQLAPRMSGVFTPVWSPDEKLIAFRRQSGFSADGVSFTTLIYVMNADGTNLFSVASVPASSRISIGLEDYPICWSADGSRILFTVQENETEAHVYSVRPDGKDLTQITTGPARDTNISCSR